MSSGVYAIKDTKSTFWKPHVQLNDHTARREFDNLINSGQTDFYSVNYADLELWCLGSYDDATGVITSDIRFVCSGTDVKKVGE